jgi:hypothetical protein
MGISYGDHHEKCTLCNDFFPPEEMSGDCCGDCAADLERQAEIDEQRRT